MHRENQQPSCPVQPINTLRTVALSTVPAELAFNPTALRSVSACCTQFRAASTRRRIASRSRNQPIRPTRLKRSRACYPDLKGVLQARAAKPDGIKFVLTAI